MPERLTTHHFEPEPKPGCPSFDPETDITSEERQRIKALREEYRRDQHWEDFARLASLELLLDRHHQQEKTSY